jgi:hypothetical protein
MPEVVLNLTHPTGSQGPYATTRNAAFNENRNRVSVSLTGQQLEVSSPTSSGNHTTQETVTRPLNADITSPTFEGTLVIRRTVSGLGGPDGLGNNFESVDAAARGQVTLAQADVRSLVAQGQMQNYLQTVANTPSNEPLPTVAQYRERLARANTMTQTSAPVGADGEHGLMAAASGNNVQPPPPVPAPAFAIAQADHNAKQPAATQGTIASSTGAGIA